MSASPSPFRSAKQREVDRQAKKQALLEAAVRMFNTRGFHATSLDDVAASLGVSKPTIYHYLGNKENVLSECLRMGLEQLLQAATDARSTKGDAAQRLHRFLVGYAHVNLSEFGRCVIRTPDEALGAENLESLLTLKRRVHAAMCDFIREGMEEGSIARCDPNLMAFTLAGALNWPARWYDPNAGHDADKTVDAMVENLAKGFLPR